MQGLSGCLVYSWSSKPTASCGIETLRIEASVLGRVMTMFPSASWVACLLTEIVRVATSKSDHSKATKAHCVKLTGNYEFRFSPI